MNSLWHPDFSVNIADSAACVHLTCRAKTEQFPLKRGGEEGIPLLFDNPDFFKRIAEKSLMSGCSPDLLFFAFYFQPVRHNPHALHLPMGRRK